MITGTTSSSIVCSSRMLFWVSTIMPPLNAAIGVVRASGSRYMLSPRGGRLLVSANRIPASRRCCTACNVAGVSTLSWGTSVPSTSESSNRIFGTHRGSDHRSGATMRSIETGPQRTGSYSSTSGGFSSTGSAISHCRSMPSER